MQSCVAMLHLLETISIPISMTMIMSASATMVMSMLFIRSSPFTQPKPRHCISRNTSYGT